jgi:RNA polymerase sigma-70 factor (ECF subfamily)
MFPDLVRAQQDLVYSIALRLSATPADAEDAAQDVFVKAYYALKGYDHDRRSALQVRPWLAAITLNVCRNRGRSRGRRPQEALAPGDRAGGGPSPSDVAADRETASELAAALGRLPEPQRRAIVLHHGGALTYAEVAEALRRPEGTVKADVHRGLAALRSILQPRELPA